jgi:Fe-S-cluster containining protein
MTKHFGHGMTETDNLGNPCVRKVRGRCVFQDDEGLCNAQRLGLKPLACKLWPFMVFKEPRRRFEAEASFRHQGRESFVYVDTAFPCNGLNKGNPEELPLILAEAVEVARDQGRAQHHTTASTGSGPSAR